VRRLTDRARLTRFMRSLGQATVEPTTVYLTGGATAVLHGFRDATVDVDISIDPDRGDLLRAVPALKEELELNVELASPDLFIPVSEGWQDRSPLIDTVGRVEFRHFDLVAQVLAKIERGHEQDLRDVRDLIGGGHVDPAAVRAELGRIEPELYRFPAVDPATLRSAVEAALSAYGR
jgi:hypothetical protein